VTGISGVTAIAAAGDTSYALTSEGAVWAWGSNAYGQLGNTQAARTEPTPVKVSITGVARIAAGGTHALAVRTDGSVWAWGNNNTGQLGDGASCGKTCTSPVRAGSISTASAIAAGYVHSLAALDDGTALAWGRGAEGELGTGSTSVKTSPTAVSTLDGVRPGTTTIDTAYTYDSAGLRATATTGGQTARYTWDTSAGLPTLLSDGTSDVLSGPSSAPLASVGSNGDRAYFKPDPLGSVRMTTGSAGAVTATSDYDAFGRPTTQTGTAAPFGFAGQLTDPSGLQYLRARYYDPSSGRFLSTDPVAPDLRDPYVSAYVYANNSPTAFTDPSGQCLIVCAVVGAVVGGIVGGVAYAVTTDDFSWGGLGAAAGTGALVGGVIGFTGGLGIVAGGAVAEGLGLGLAGTVGVTAVGGAVGTVAGHYGVNTAMGVPYTGTDAVIDTVTGGLAGGLSGALSSLSRTNQLLAAAEECLGTSTKEQSALRIALREGRVKDTAPVNHLNGAMAEELGWESALDAGNIGVQGPGKITAVGPDYITFDPTTNQIVVWDAKYSSNGSFPSGSISSAKLTSWNAAIGDAVNNYTGPGAAAIKQAYANGAVVGQYFKYP
jgi:RHS repeat-associated protein